MNTDPQFPDTPGPGPNPEAATSNDSPTPKRAIQFVTTLAQRRQMAEWMMQEVARCGTDKHIASKAVRQFPGLFPGNAKANLMRASRIWRQRLQLIDPDLHLPTTPVHLSPIPSVATRIQKQALPGRGRKRASWSDALQRDLLREYQRLSSAGMRFSPKVMRTAAISLVNRSTSSEYCATMEDPRSEKPLLECVTSRWVRAFADRYHLPLETKAVTGAMPESRRVQRELSEKMAAYHLGQIARLFESGAVRESDMETLSQIHFVINKDTGKTLGFGESEPPQYSDLVGRTCAVTLLIRVSGGCGAVVEPPFVILQDPEYRYPLLGGPESVTHVSYRTSPSGWMDRVVLSDYLKDPNAISPLPNGRKRIMMVEPALWHSYASDFVLPLRELNTELKYFPQNCPELVRPVDALLRQAITESWARGWEQLKEEMQELRTVSRDSALPDGHIEDIAPHQFLKLAALAIQDVNNLRDENGLPFPRKAMTESGMALNSSGRWELRQLHPDLVRIVTRHREHFEGRIITAEPKNEPVSEEGLPEPLQIVGHHVPQVCSSPPVTIVRREQVPQQHA